MNVQKLNIHFYDGQLRERVSLLNTIYSGVRNIPLNKKLEALRKLWSKVEEHKTNFVSNVSKAVFAILIADVMRGVNNYDPTNGFYIDDLLYMCYLISEQDPPDDFYHLFVTQLAEMQNGMCVQGRAYRLLQVVLNYTP